MGKQSAGDALWIDLRRVVLFAVESLDPLSPVTDCDLCAGDRRRADSFRLIRIDNETLAK